MLQVECGFPNQPGYLIQFGPTLKVLIGFDPNYRSENDGKPNLPANEYAALIDTEASESCIDSTVAATSGLPVVNEAAVSGAHGQVKVNVHLAQIYIPEPLAQLSRFGRPRPAFRFRQGRDTGSGGCPGRLHEPKCGGMPQLVAHRAPSAHGWPCRPLRGGVRGGRICQNQWCQMVSRISCSTVRASTPKNRWQATLACPRTRTCRAP